MAAVDDYLYVSKEENGLVRWLTKGSPNASKWQKLKGTPAAWVVLALEVTCAHIVRSATEAFTIWSCFILQTSFASSLVTEHICGAIGLLMAALIGIPFVTLLLGVQYVASFGGLF